MEHGEEGLNEIFQYETLYEKSKNDEAKLYLDELNRVKTELILEQPLFSHLLSTFQIMVVEKKLAKFAIDNIYFYFSESYIAELINERDHWKGKIKGDLLHMIMHIIYRHYEREEKFDRKEIDRKEYNRQMRNAKYNERFRIHDLAGRLRSAGHPFVIEPYLRFEGLPGEQWTMFLLDPSGKPPPLSGHDWPGLPT